MPTKKKLGGKVSYKKRTLDTSGLGYQRAKEIESMKAQQATDEKLNRALDAILRKENIKKPTMQEKQEAYKKLMDDTTNKIITNQNNQLMSVAKSMMQSSATPKPKTSRVPIASIKKKVALNSPTPFKSEPLPQALLPPTTYSDYVGDIKSIMKQGTQMLNAYEEGLDTNNLAPQAKKKQVTTIISPSTPPSMPQVMQSSATSLDKPMRQSVSDILFGDPKKSETRGRPSGSTKAYIADRKAYSDMIQKKSPKKFMSKQIG
jgi:hypothetical protein